MIGEPTPEGECSVHSRKWWRTRAIAATKWCLVWTSWSCEPTLPSPIAALGTGSARRRRRLRYTATGGGFRAIAARVLQRHRRERIERNFAHRFDTGGLGRLYVRGKENVHKKFLIQAAACNLALLMRSMYGSGKPRAAHDRIVDAILTILALMKAVEDILTASSAMFYSERRISRGSDRCH